MLISVRGSHGAGKSTVARQLLASGNGRPLYGAGIKRPEAYRLDLPGGPTFLIGPYESACGGCDAVQPFSRIIPLIQKYADRGHVVFEGSLIASCWGQVGKLLESRGPEAVVVYLDTPLDLCIARVNARRAERGKDGPFDPVNVISKFESIAKQQRKVEAAGIVSTLTPTSERAASVIEALLGMA